VQKRKEHVLGRALSGERINPDLAVSLSTVQFAAKLKMRVAAQGRATGAAEGQTADATPESPKRASGEKTWAEKRKESYLKRHNRLPPVEAQVAVTAVSFAVKLKSRAAASQSAREGEALTPATAAGQDARPSSGTATTTAAVATALEAHLVTADAPATMEAVQLS